MRDLLFYREENTDVYIRATGRVTAPICYQLREKVFARLNASPPVENMYIDLSYCDYMDSTFMGIILGINKKMKKTTGKGVIIVCPTEECSTLFTALNILQFLNVDTKAVKFPKDMEAISVFEKPQADLLLRAHDDLIEVSEANAQKFRVLREILSKKVIEERKRETEKNIEDDETDEDEPDDHPLIGNTESFDLDD